MDIPKQIAERLIRIQKKGNMKGRKGREVVVHKNAHKTDREMIQEIVTIHVVKDPGVEHLRRRSISTIDREVGLDPDQGSTKSHTKSTRNHMIRDNFQFLLLVPW